MRISVSYDAVPTYFLSDPTKFQPLSRQIVGDLRHFFRMSAADIVEGAEINPDSTQLCRISCANSLKCKELDAAQRDIQVTSK